MTPVSVLIQQRVLPHYRVGFFEALRPRVGNLAIIAAAPSEAEGIVGPTREVNFKWIQSGNTSFGLYGSEVWWSKRFLRAACREQNAVDVVVVEANPRNLSAFAILSLPRRLRPPIVIWGLGEMSRTRSPLTGALHRLAMTFLIRRAEAAVAYGTAARDTYKKYGADPGAVFVAPNSLWLEVPVDLTSRSQVPAMEGYLLYVGRLAPGKGVEILFDALARLESRIHVVIAGDGPLRDRVSELAARSRHQVEMRGFVDLEALPELMSRAWSVVVPGRGGLTIDIATRVGTPVVVANADGTERELVLDGKTGVYFEAGSATSLADVLSALVNDPPRLEKLQRSAISAASAAARRADLMISGFVEASLYAASRRERSPS